MTGQSGRLVARGAARTAAERANDQALEWAILLARWGGLLACLASLAGWVALVWTGDWLWGVTSALGSVLAAVAGWWGWWLKGNEEWRGE